MTRVLRRTLLAAIAALLVAALTACGDVEEIFADDYGSRDFQTYTIASESSEASPVVSVTPPEWVIGVSASDAPEDDPSAALSYLTCTFEGGHYVFGYGPDDAEEYVAYYVNEDTVITDHLFGGRFTDIRIGDIRHETIAGHDVVWGSYTYLNEYERLCVAYVGATNMGDGQVLNLTMNEEIRDEGTEPFLSEDVFREVWESATW